MLHLTKQKHIINEKLKLMSAVVMSNSWMDHMEIQNGRTYVMHGLFLALLFSILLIILLMNSELELKTVLLRRLKTLCSILRLKMFFIMRDSIFWKYFGKFFMLFNKHRTLCRKSWMDLWNIKTFFRYCKRADCWFLVWISFLCVRMCDVEKEILDNVFSCLS